MVVLDVVHQLWIIWVVWRTLDLASMGFLERKGSRIKISSAHAKGKVLGEALREMRSGSMKMFQSRGDKTAP